MWIAGFTGWRKKPLWNSNFWFRSDSAGWNSLHLHIDNNYEETNERIFFQLSNYPSVLEQVLRASLTPPSSNPSTQLSFPSRFFRISTLQVSMIQPASVLKLSSRNPLPPMIFEMSENNKTLKAPKWSANSKPKRSESTTTAKPATIHHRKCLNCFALQRQCGAVDPMEPRPFAMPVASNSKQGNFNWVRKQFKKTWKLYENTRNLYNPNLYRLTYK